MNRAMIVVAICLVASLMLGCTGTPDSGKDRTKDFPLTISKSMILPGILDSLSLSTPAAGNVYLALKVRMDNKGQTSASLGASEFEVMLDSKSYSCSFLTATDTDPRFDGQDFGSVNILPGSFVEGWMIFEVPSSASSAATAELRFTDRALIGGGQYSKVSFNPGQATKYTTISERLKVEVKTMTISYKYTEDDNEIKASSANKLYAIGDFIITNNARKKLYYAATLTDILFCTEDNDYEQSSSFSMPAPVQPLESGDIQPAASIKGTVITEVPKDDSYVTKVTVEYSSTEKYSYSIPDSRIKTVKNTAPVAVITSEDTAFIDTDVDFDATASTDANGDPLTYSWDFGVKGVSYDTSTSARPKYKYAEPGTYTVQLKTVDVGGLESTVTKEIEISHFFSLAASNHGIETDPTTYHDGEFFVDVRLTNNADETKSVYSTDFQMKTSDGAFYDWHGDDGKDPSSLGPGASATWRIYFEIPSGKTPVMVVFDDTVTANI